MCRQQNTLFIWTFCVLIFTDMKPEKNSIWFVSMFMKNWIYVYCDYDYDDDGADSL